ncbi:MAG: SAM-dependent methyltransferase [Bacteroidota bacterium]
MNKGTLYLLPTPISADYHELALPAGYLDIVNRLEVFITENIRTTRRFLRSIGFQKDFDTIPYYLLNKHTSAQEISTFLDLAMKGAATGLFSEAGMPCIADPGAKIVKMAHEKNVAVVPVNGPSSIMLSLAASGFNGQNFAFHGYLPVQQTERNRSLKALENAAIKQDQTQIFIEAPYRNNQMLSAITQACKPETLLCIASEINSRQEFIKTWPVKTWKEKKINLHKKNTIFLLYKETAG